MTDDLTDDIELNAQQADAAERILSWVRDWHRATARSQVFRLFGFAGTGKTTMLKNVVDRLDGHTLFAAYTGKASRVMLKKGLHGATTIHSLCYRPNQVSDQLIAELQYEISRLPPGDLKRIVLEERLAEIRKPTFEINPDSAARGAGLIAIDECSMVDGRMGHDLLSFDRPVLVSGDPGQLPPIEGRGFFTDPSHGPPDVMLTEITRQAAGNPIIGVSALAREGAHIKFGRHGNTVLKIPKVDRDRDKYGLPDHLDRIMQVAQVVTGKNDTRMFLNRLIRAELGRGHPKHQWLPVEADKVIIRRNDHDLALLNGDEVTFRDIEWVPDSKTFTATIIRDDGTDVRYPSGAPARLRIYVGRFQDTYNVVPRREDMDHFVLRNSILADFGYALTVHVSQGSQWRSVMVVNERLGGSTENQRQWLYTGVTRAQKLLVILG